MIGRCVVLLLAFMVHAIAGTTSTTSSNVSTHVPNSLPGLSHHYANVVRNGDDASGKFPTVGELKQDNDEVCSGTALPEKPCVVISAAHCVYKREAGTTKFIVDGKEYKAKDFHAPNKVQIDDGQGSVNNFTPDLVLVELQSSLPIPADQNFKVNTQELKEGEEITVVGFGEVGREKKPKGKTSGVMKFSKYAEKNRISFPKKFRGLTTVAQLLPTTNNNSTCEGDSGGPAFAKDGSLIGVNSSASVYGPPNIWCARPANDVDLKDPKLIDAKCGPYWSGDKRHVGHCIDSVQKLVWMEFKDPGNFREFFAKKFSATPFSQNVAKSVCNLLNGASANREKEFAEYVKSRKDENDANSATQMGELAQQSDGQKTWRLPSRGEYERLRGSPRGKEIFGDEWDTKRTLWLSDAGKELSAMAAAFDGKIMDLPNSPGNCDLIYRSNVTSLHHYKDWLKTALDSIKCPAPPPKLDAFF